MNIISAYQQVGSYRGAAELCGTTHKTVKRVIERAEAGEPPPREPRLRNLDAFTDLVATRVDKSNGRMSAKPMLPIARAAGYQGSARNFRRLVAQQKVLWRKANRHQRRPAVWSPGDLVMDWAEAAPGFQKACTTLAMVAEALEAIGGVPAKGLVDRMGGLKGGVVANVVVPTSDYVRFASHYGFVADFRHGAIRSRRGIVEKLCGYAQEDLAVPLLTEAALTGEQAGLRALNVEAASWCAEVDAAVHAETCAVPNVRLVEERTVLTALPSLRPAIGAGSVCRKVDSLSCIR